MEAVKALGAEVRDNPTDARRRTFLFELLCFAGEFERADKQLEVLGQAGPNSEIGVLLYRSALYAERQRQDLFAHGELPKAAEPGLPAARAHSMASRSPLFPMPIPALDLGWRFSRRARTSCFPLNTSLRFASRRRNG